MNLKITKYLNLCKETLNHLSDILNLSFWKFLWNFAKSISLKKNSSFYQKLQFFMKALSENFQNKKGWLEVISNKISSKTNSNQNKISASNLTIKLV